LLIPSTIPTRAGDTPQCSVFYGQQMSTSAENTPVYFEAISGWMATHLGRMPGMVPTSDESKRARVVDTPYMDDVAKNGISPWGRNRGVIKP